MTDTATHTADAHTAQPSLAGRRAIITGGTTGIGRAVAVLLASQGVRVFICGRNPQHLADALQRIGGVGEGDGLALDLARQQDIDRFVEAGTRFLGGIDLAVINAGLAAGGVEDTDVHSIRYTVDTNLTAMMTATRLVAERMEAGSDIVFIGSIAAVSRGAGSSVYAATKTGIEAFAEALGKELAEREIKVGNIEPGLVGTDMHLPDIPVEKQREMIAAGEMMRAEDVAVAVRFMLAQPRRTRVSLIRMRALGSG